MQQIESEKLPRNPEQRTLSGHRPAEQDSSSQVEELHAHLSLDGKEIYVHCFGEKVTRWGHQAVHAGHETNK